MCLVGTRAPGPLSRQRALYRNPLAIARGADQPRRVAAPRLPGRQGREAPGPLRGQQRRLYWTVLKASSRREVLTSSWALTSTGSAPAGSTGTTCRSPAPPSSRPSTKGTASRSSTAITRRCRSGSLPGPPTRRQSSYDSRGGDRPVCAGTPSALDGTGHRQQDF